MFTLNNFTSEEVKTLENLAVENYFKFISFQEEIGENGTPHLQGYFILPKRTEFPVIKRKLPGRAHLDVRKGNHSQALAYVTKNETKKLDGISFQFGTSPNDDSKASEQGRRNDLMIVKEAIDSGAAELELWDEFFPQMVKYRNNLSYYRSLKSPRRNKKTHVMVFWGPTGTGKSKTAFEIGGEDTYNLCPGQNVKNGTVFFDGYIGQKTVIFDEFYGSSMPWTQLLALTDRYPARVMIKGTSAIFNPENLIITSNQNPMSWYTESDTRSWPTLERRLDSIVNFKSLEERIATKIIKCPEVPSEEILLKEIIFNEHRDEGRPNADENTDLESINQSF